MTPRSMRSKGFGSDIWSIRERSCSHCPRSQLLTAAPPSKVIERAKVEKRLVLPNVRTVSRRVSDMIPSKDETVLRYLFLWEVWSRSGLKDQLVLEAELFFC